MEIIIPKRKSYYNFIILLFLIGIALNIIFTSEQLDLVISLIAISLLIIVFTIFTLYLFFGQEKVTINDNYLILIRKLIIQDELIKIKLSEIEKIEYRKGGQNPANIMLEPVDYIINRMSNIAIIQKKKFLKIGIGIYDFEAKPIIEKLNKVISNAQ